MKEFIKWLLENWQLVATFVLLIINLVISICKKKVKIIDTNLTMALSVLPDLIISAEKVFGSGTGHEKLEFVLKSVIEFLVRLTGKTEKEITEVYGITLKTAIEDILSTPTKKGN